MIDPTISLAFSMYSMKGVYALLIGSGISRAAGIPTGWEIVLDLIRKVAHLKGSACGPDPLKWYKDTFGAEAEYGKLLDTLSSNQSERAQLLKPYFEPSVLERQQGLKLPTEAHRAIAKLVKGGYIRVIITTNFDHLIEQAIHNIGETPIVISTGDAVDGAMPLTHVGCTIIKVNGDYVDVRIKNTQQELATYDARIDRLLDRVFDEYGLIICGWSGQWDTALNAAIERCPSHRFTTYWASTGELTYAATRLIASRRATHIAIRDGNTFFRELVEKTLALSEYEHPHPLSKALAVATVKRYLPEERHRIRLHDLVREETEKTYIALFTGMDFSAKNVQKTVEEVQRRLDKYDDLMQTLIGMVLAGSYWSKSQHAELWSGTLERIGNPPKRQGGSGILLNLEMYPALLLLLALSAANVAAGNYPNLSALIKVKTFRDKREGASLLLDLLYPYKVIDKNTMNMVFQTRKVLAAAYILPVSEHLFQSLRELLREYIPDDTKYERCFDRSEYLLDLCYADLRQQTDPSIIRGPIGRYVYKDPKNKDHIMNEIGRELLESGPDWPPFQAGMFGSSPEKFSALKNEFDKIVVRFYENNF